VYEGDSLVSDCPVITVMGELVSLAEHADDGFAYAHIKCSPVAEAMYPEGLPPPEELSAELLADFTRKGMLRKFREVREALKKVPGSWNDFAESRFEDFIKCAAEFEENRDSTMRLSDFIAYLSHKTRRDFAEPGMVRIMTMHQSKGLGFDWVIIPFYEPDKFVSGHHTGPLEHSDPDWITVNPGPDIAMADPVLARSERERRLVETYNSLCLDYVAMTRAKLALTIILHPQNSKPPAEPEKFSDLVRLVGLKTAGDPAWYRNVKAGGAGASVPARRKVVRKRRLPVKKFRPSESFFTALAADALFSDDFGKAARTGGEVHARYEKIEWAGPESAAALPEAFREAFVKPSVDATVWRERPYELFAGGRWESGQFDRVVFTGRGESRRAVIYDFKTNAVRAGENDAAFAARMRETYGRQMASYRRALSLLTGIAPESIETRLLLESTGKSVSVPLFVEEG
jgi:ATP-dependent exoDNAse (exonuclease V) beta subunit